MLHFPEKSAYNVYDLVKLIEMLRSPEGCPWDREQTHESHRRDLIEEAYEVAEAIDNHDSEHLKEELGDLLLAVVFHTQIEHEGRGFSSKGFDIDAVADNTIRKLVFRHPHVFGDVTAESSADVLDNWDELKKQERKEEALVDSLNNVSRSLPALWRAEKIVKKIKKADREINLNNNTDIEKIIGDNLLISVKTAHDNGIDPELALHNACERLIARFI